MLHHDHARDKPLTAEEREALLRQGATAQGIVMHSELAPDDRRKTRVRVTVRFKDGQQAEFSEELDNLYQPAPGSAEAQRLADVRGAEQLRHPDRIPKIQLPLSDGERVPVRYDEAHPGRIVLDVPALRARALKDYIRREQQPHQQQPPPRSGSGAAAGPPWIVPAHCPNCGAPVDQARASRDADPLCQFCRQPLPVSPVR